MIAAADSLSSPTPMEGHASVLARETLAFLGPRDGGVYLDATFGGGGHARLLLEAGATTVVALDCDPEAAERAAHLARQYGGRFRFRRMNFRDLDQLEEGPFDGALFDFGVSSFQLDEPGRGFSFRGDAPLDMRLDPASGLSAADWLAQAGREELVRAVRDYGEERNWRRVVGALLEARERGPLRTTGELAELVLESLPARRRYGSRIHPATKIFQGLRIAVNDELGAIEKGLPAAFERLASSGVLCAISFHSLEDRIVKRLFRHWAGRPEGPDDHRPQSMRETRATLLCGRPVTASDTEVAANPRSRSAKLRAIRKEA